MQPKCLSLKTLHLQCTLKCSQLSVFWGAPGVPKKKFFGGHGALLHAHTSLLARLVSGGRYYEPKQVWLTFLDQSFERHYEKTTKTHGGQATVNNSRYPGQQAFLMLFKRYIKKKIKIKNKSHWIQYNYQLIVSCSYFSFSDSSLSCLAE